jgi:hypothetical protein
MRETQVPIAGISAAKTTPSVFYMFLAFDYVMRSCGMRVKNFAKGACLAGGGSFARFFGGSCCLLDVEWGAGVGAIVPVIGALGAGNKGDYCRVSESRVEDWRLF